jgi:hypothetical protein
MSLINGNKTKTLGAGEALALAVERAERQGSMASAGDLALIAIGLSLAELVKKR